MKTDILTKRDTSKGPQILMSHCGCPTVPIMRHKNQVDQTNSNGMNCMQDHIRLLEKLINPALFEDGVTRLNFILMAVVEAKNVAPLVARISKLK